MLFEISTANTYFQDFPGSPHAPSGCWLFIMAKIFVVVRSAGIVEMSCNSTIIHIDSGAVKAMEAS